MYNLNTVCTAVTGPKYPFYDLDNLTLSLWEQKATGKVDDWPHTLIVYDFAVKDVKGMSIKNTKIYCLSVDMVCDETKWKYINSWIHILAEPSTVKWHDSVHWDIGTTLLNSNQNYVNMTLMIYSTVLWTCMCWPSTSSQKRRRSRLMIALNTWLSAAYALHSVHIFIRQKDFAFTH